MLFDRVLNYFISYSYPNTLSLGVIWGTRSNVSIWVTHSWKNWVTLQSHTLRNPFRTDAEILLECKLPLLCRKQQLFYRGYLPKGPRAILLYHHGYPQHIGLFDSPFCKGALESCTCALWWNNGVNNFACTRFSHYVDTASMTICLLPC